MGSKPQYGEMSFCTACLILFLILVLFIIIHKLFTLEYDYYDGYYVRR